MVVWHSGYHSLVVNDACLRWMDLDMAAASRHPQIDLEAGRFFETGHRGRPSNRRTDPARQRDARGQRPRRATRTHRRRTGLLHALETNDSAVAILGDEVLRTIARELVDKVRTNVTIDWTLREDVRARLRVLVRRTLRRYDYPPDKQEQATQTVLQQAEVLSEAWAP